MGLMNKAKPVTTDATWQMHRIIPPNEKEPSDKEQG